MNGSAADRQASISRRQFLVHSGLASVSIASIAGSAGSQHRQKSHPNIVLIYADDLGWNDAGCYGNPVVKTPNTDRIAEEGVRFTRAYVTSPSCSASRASLLTGRYPHTHGVKSLIQWHVPWIKAMPFWYKGMEERTYRHSLKRSETVMPQTFKKLGYATALLGKWHVSVDAPTEWDVDEVNPDPADFFARNRTNPFFFCYCPDHTHRPFKKSQDFLYDPAEIPLPPYFNEDAELRSHLADYYSAVSNQDREIGKILGALDENDLVENTIVILSSDNGPPFARSKTTLYDWGVHTPLLVRYPARLKAGTVVDALASTIDVFPTLLELLGEPIPERLQGVSLLGAMEDARKTAREAVFCEANCHIYYNVMRSVRTDRWEYIKNFTPEAPYYDIPKNVPENIRRLLENEFVGLKSLKTPMSTPPNRPVEELFDMKADPLESRNLVEVPDHQSTLAEMRQRLERWMRLTNDDPMADVEPYSEYRRLVQQDSSVK